MKTVRFPRVYPPPPPCEGSNDFSPSVGVTNDAWKAIAVKALARLHARALLDVGQLVERRLTSLFHGPREGWQPLTVDAGNDWPRENFMGTRRQPERTPVFINFIFSRRLSIKLGIIVFRLRNWSSDFKEATK